MQNRLVLIFALGFLIRFILSFLPGFEIDMGAWRAWSLRLADVGPANFYSEEIWTHYLPGYLFVLWPLGILAKLFSFDPYGQFFSFFLKLPSLVADMGIAFLIAKILEKKLNPPWPLFGASAYLFNPIVLFNGAIWGQADSVFTLFLLSSFYLLLEKKPYPSILSFALSLFIKPQAGALLPLFVFIFWRNFKLKILLQSGLLSLIFIFFLSLPFFIRNPIYGLPELYLKMEADYPYTSLFAFNFWWIFDGWKSDTTVGYLLSTQVWGIILWSLSQLFIFFLLAKKKIGVYLAASLATFSFFLFPTRIHERYLFPFFPFFILALPILSKRVFLTFYIVLSFIHLANLYFVYTYYNPNFIKIETLASSIQSGAIYLAITTVISFLALSFVILKSKE